LSPFARFQPPLPPAAPPTLAEGRRFTLAFQTLTPRSADSLSPSADSFMSKCKSLTHPKNGHCMPLATGRRGDAATVQFADNKKPQLRAGANARSTPRLRARRFVPVGLIRNLFCRTRRACRVPLLHKVDQLGRGIGSGLPPRSRRPTP